MNTYLRNLYLWASGWFWFDRLTWKPGWRNGPKWWALYLLDHGACVLFLGGAVETISSYAQRHRSGTVWDKLLDVIERVDPGHGVDAEGTLWGSEESPLWVRVAVPIGWVVLCLSVLA
jgi:hypothetical protein